MTMATLAGLMLAVSAYGASRGNPGAGVAKQAELYQIDSIEQTWHKAASLKNLDLFMSLWAPNATATVAGKTVTGKAAIRRLFAKSGPFQPQNHWVSDTPSYKIRATVNGNKGTLYFECHYIDVDTGMVAAVVGAHQEVQKINGKWLITNLAASTVTLKP
jgi:transposase InsO family protein